MHFLCFIYEYFLSFVRVHVSDFRLIHLWHQVIPSEVLSVSLHRRLYQHFQPCLKTTANVMGKRWEFCSTAKHAVIAAPSSSLWDHSPPMGTHRPFIQPQIHRQPRLMVTTGSTWSNLYGDTFTTFKHATFSDSSECLLEMSDFQPFFKHPTF